MGRPKIAIIDDSQPVEEKKKKNPNQEEQKQTIDDRKVEDSTLKIENGELKENNPSSTINPQNTTLNLPPSTVKKAQKPGKAKPRSKKYQESVEGLERSKQYPLAEAVELTKKLSYSNFTGTLEAHINTSQTGIRGLVSLPFASGKKLKIVAFGNGADLSGADVAGNDETIEEINKGKIDFDLLVTTPEWMPKLAKVARILDPRGLMPNPKNGTITDDLKRAVEGFQAGKTEYKTEPKAQVIHLGLGKLDQPTEELSANIKTLLQTVGKTRVKKVSLSPTMGPSVKMDLSSI